MRIRTLLAMVCLLGLAALSAQAYRLQFKDPQGATRTYKMAMQMKGATEVMGMSIPMDSTITMLSVEKVLAKNANGTSSISYTLKEGKMQATITVPGAEEAEKIEQPMPSFSMTYNRTATGKVTELKFTGELDPAIRQQLDAMNGQMQYPGQGIEFPDRELKIGDSWEGVQKFSLGAGADMDFTVKYTLVGTKEVNGKTYLVLDSVINAKAADLTMSVPAPDGVAAAVKLKISMTLTGKSTSLFDERAGELGNSTFSMNIVMAMASEGSEGLAMKMKMNMTGEMIRQ